jgi:asparagine synthase (glutamine-hydrolysing)
MSGICGIFQRNGAPVAPARLERMMTAMASWGADGQGTWCDGPVALGHSLVHTTPESRYESLPLQSPAPAVVLTVTSRLDNRDELADALGIAPPDRTTLPDSTLILKAYGAWGEACPVRLLGDWAFALWDTRQRRLFLARDQHGNTGLFYYCTPHCFAFASCLAGLLALPEVPRRPHTLAVAQLLMPWPGDGRATLYADLWHVPPAHAMVVIPDRMTMRQYWNVEATPALRLASDAAYVEAFLDLYTAAVRCRLRSIRPVGILLSGGLDSGSVAALAARALRDQGRPRLQAWSAVPAYPTAGLVDPQRCGDESPWIAATCQHVGHIEAHLHRADEVSPLRGIERLLEILQQPNPIVINGYWICALLDAARAQNIGVLLTGQGGNATVSWHGSRAAASAAWRQLPGLWRTLWTQYTRHGVALDRAIWRYGIAPLLPRGVWHAWQRWRTRSRPCSDRTALHPAMAKAVGLDRPMHQEGEGPTFGRYQFDARQGRAFLLQSGLAMLGTVWHNIGAAWGMAVWDPTLDKRLLEFCWAIPEDQYARPDGSNRLLMRRGMQELLPPAVVWNQHRGQQAADIALRLHAQWEEVERALTRLEQAALPQQYLDLARMRTVLAALHTTPSASVTFDCWTILLRGLSVGLWLQQLGDAPQASTPPPLSS